jgi:amidase
MAEPPRYVPPSEEELAAIGDRLGFALSGAERAMFRRYAADLAFAYDRVAALDEALPPVRYPRAGWRRPIAAENPHNAWFVTTAVKGAAAGPLAGRRVALKDTIALAGVPMADGSDLLDGLVPSFDATLVTRILDAGGEIAGKAACEYLSYSSGSHTAATGPVENPLKPGYSAGGSSSGSAALVASGAVDMAIGGDQAGSIRIPSAHCGLYGLKPTWGRVSYAGIVSSAYVIDHAGPIARTVADNALLLEAIAGADPLDPRTAGTPAPERYSAALDGDVKGMRIGVVEEGFGHRSSMPEVDALVRRAAARFADLGAAVEPVALPWHRDGLAIWLVFAMEGYHGNLMRANGFGGNSEALHWTALNDALARWRDRPQALPPNLKLGMLMGEYADERFRHHYYVRAMNLAQRLRAAYDAALARYDALLMPTVPAKAGSLPPLDAPAEQVIDLAFENIDNTCPFNLTHHPALSVPCGLADGCPVGLMLVGRHFAEATLYRLGHAFERAVEWRALRS